MVVVHSAATETGENQGIVFSYGIISNKAVKEKVKKNKKLLSSVTS